jgi:acetyltransferase-like isoleucine patch superfamily enzyme
VEYFKHDSAEVSDNAHIGAGAKVWHGVQVMPGASVGEATILGKDVYVDAGVSIGARVKVQNHASLYKGSVVEDEAFIGPNAVLANDLRPRACTPDGALKTEMDWTARGATIKKGASVGAGCVVLPGVVVGSYAMVGAGSVVTEDLPDHALALGTPARVVGSVCSCGERLDPSLRCGKCGRSYVSTDGNVRPGPRSSDA